MTDNKDLLPALRELLGEWRKHRSSMETQEQMFSRDGRLNMAFSRSQRIVELDNCIRDLEQLIKDEK